MTKAVDDRRRGRAREPAPKKSLKDYAPSPPVVASAAAAAEAVAGVAGHPPALELSVRTENERLVDRLGERLQQALSIAGYDRRVEHFQHDEAATKRADLDRDARHAHSKMVADAIVQGFGLLSCAVLIGTILVLAVR